MKTHNQNIKNRPQKEWAGLAKNVRHLCERYEIRASYEQ